MAVLSTIVCSIFGLICALAVWMSGGSPTSVAMGYIVPGAVLYVLWLIGGNFFCHSDAVSMEREIATDLLALSQRDGDGVCYIRKNSV